MERFLFALRVSPLLLYATCWSLLLRCFRPVLSLQQLSRLSLVLLHPLPVTPRTLIRVTAWLDRIGVFGKNQCLIRSLVLYRMLRQVDAQPLLVIGFAEAVNGHAWVEWQGVPVCESSEVLARYRPMFIMDAHASRVSIVGKPIP